MKNIIACIDGSQSTISTCEGSAWVAKTLDAPLVLFHALDKTTRPVLSEFSGQIGLGSQEELLDELAKLDETRSKIMLEHSHKMLDSAYEWACRDGVSNVKKLQRHGSLLETLSDLTSELRVLVIGKSGEHHSSKNIIGSQLESVIRAVDEHILVVSDHFKAPHSYMIAFDGSPISQKLIDKATRTPLLKGLPCHLTTIDESSTKSVAFEQAKQQLKSAGMEVTAACLNGPIDEALLTYQQQHKVGMIVMGAYGHSKLRQVFVGSNTTKVLANSEVPLLLIR
ncbi:universal stress protein [Vibrio methylphosphonaticus]|uniref:universal stress protein n=1 Tax=Vibrio methylphosphonaticus TaxID=2946866 RepID=UPI002029E36B|nr:universal stress protein [Vibrio methylphosphonaticus]MCL9775778.1 universal stress protein [Vibrio methylphosphonaticus]